jgi:hypothetical protein
MVTCAASNAELCIGSFFRAVAGFSGLRISFAILLIFPICAFLFANRLEQ